MNEQLDPSAVGISMGVAFDHSHSAELSTLLRTTFANGIRSYGDFNKALLVNSTSPVWRRFFLVEAKAFILEHCPPRGSMDDIKAAWMIRTFARGGVISSALHCRLILEVVKACPDVPDDLRVLALDQVRLALGEDRGGYSESRPVARSGMTRYDVDYILHLLAPLGKNDVFVLPEKIRTVVENIATQANARDNHPSWQKLLNTIRESGHPQPQPRRPWLRIENSPSPPSPA